VYPPSAAGADSAQLLDVHVDEVAGPLVLVAADDAARGPVEPAEPLQAQAAEHPVHRGGGHPQAVADASRAQLQPATELLDPADHPQRRAMWALPGTARTVVQPDLAFCTKPAPPAIGGLT